MGLGGRAIAIVRWDVSQFSECRRDAGSLSRLGGRSEATIRRDAFQVSECRRTLFPFCFLLLREIVLHALK